MKNLFYKMIIILTLSLVSLSPKLTPNSPIEKKITLKRIWLQPSQYLAKMASSSPLGLNLAHSDLTEHYQKKTIDECKHQSGDVRGIWNEFLSCTFVQFVNFYNVFTTELSKHINPDNDFSILIEEGYRIEAKASYVNGYDREVIFTNANDDVCLDLHYSKHPDNAQSAKVMIHLSSLNCDWSGDSKKDEDVAIVIKADMRYSDPKIQQAEVIALVNREKGSVFDITAQNEDMSFYESVSIDDNQTTPLTTAHSILMGKNKALKLFVSGEDDVKLNIGATWPVLAEVDDTSTSSALLSMACFDDANGGLTNGCAPFVAFPLTPNAIKNLSLPSWTKSSLIVDEAKALTDYFN